MTNSLVELTKQNSLAWGRPESPYIIGMFHDICKQDQYRHPVDATFYGGGAPIPLVDESKWEYDPDAVLKGHGEKSVMLFPSICPLPWKKSCASVTHGRLCRPERVERLHKGNSCVSERPLDAYGDMLAAHILEVDK